MSASLVGSEMCIRDSRRMREPWARRCRQTLVGPAPANRAWRGRRRAVPVSYTHLTLPTICSV
eukprot:4205741-Alexandrium_andersonii.AAC.1